MLSLHGDQAAAVVGAGPNRKAEPRVNVWDVDFGQAAVFGGGRVGASGLGCPAPARDETVNPANPVVDPARTLSAGRFAGRVDAVAPLLVSRGKVDDVAGLTKPADVVVVGASPVIAQAGLYKLSERAPGFADDRAAWRAVLSDPRYVVVDQMLGNPMAAQHLGPSGPATR
jgi:hypothetical protein